MTIYDGAMVIPDCKATDARKISILLLEFDCALSMYDDTITLFIHSRDSEEILKALSKGFNATMISTDPGK